MEDENDDARVRVYRYIDEKSDARDKMNKSEERERKDSQS